MTLLQSTDSKTFKKEEKKDILHIFLFSNKKIPSHTHIAYICTKPRIPTLYQLSGKTKPV